MKMDITSENFSINSIKLDEYLFNFTDNNTEILKRRFFELLILYSLNRNLNLSIQLEDLLNITINFFKDSLNIDEFCFMLLDNNHKLLKVWTADRATFESAKDITFNIGEGISGIVVQTGEPIMIQDVSKDSRFLYYKAKLTNIGSFLSIPLKLSDNRIIGVLNIHKKEINSFKNDDKIFFSIIARNLANAIERARLYEKVQKEAMHDYLTGLFTRRYFSENCYREFSESVRFGKTFSIIFADIDKFKYFNDTYGHPAGDDILKELASILKSNVRHGDIVCRYGGEEFAILLPCTERIGATFVAEKLRTSVETCLAEMNKSKYMDKITITVGVATYPDDGSTVDEIISTADKFLYLGKERGRNIVINSASVTPILISNKRSVPRHNIAIKIVRGERFLQFIEININGGSKKCIIQNVCKKGFKGIIEHACEVDGKYICKGIINSVSSNDEVFTIRIAHAAKVSIGRYQIGSEIIAGINSWERLYTMLIN